MRKVSYKGKWFIIEDETDELDFDEGEITMDEITDEFLEEHVKACIYYGIPAYLGNNEELKKRVDMMYEKME